MSERWSETGRDNPGDRHHGRVHVRRGVAVAAGLATILTLGYGVRVAAQGITHAWDSLGAVPGSAESGPLRHILEPEAQSIAGKAIKLTAPAKDGGPAVFQARQAGPNEVVLTAGSDSFEAGTIFNGHAALVDVTLTGRGLDAAELTPANAADVSHVFIETTTGIPRSGGSAIDRQVDLSNPETSQARDRNDLMYAVGGDHEGQAWSGIYGVNNDTNSNGYVGYSTDPSAILTGPGPNHGLPEFDSGYWGGGSPPPLFADGGNASQAQTASDAAEQAAKAFQAALAELRSN